MEAQDRAESSSNGKLKILVVEDHEDTLRVMTRLLEMGGHSVRTAANVQQALQAAANDIFDLIISDLGLPDGSGHDVMRHVRQDGNSHARGICLTGDTAQQDLAAAREAGFDAHLSKPVDFDKLRALIDEMAAR